MQDFSTFQDPLTVLQAQKSHPPTEMIQSEKYLQNSASFLPVPQIQKFGEVPGMHRERRAEKEWKSLAIS